MRNLLTEAFQEYVERDGDPYDLADFLEWAKGRFTEEYLRATLNGTPLTESPDSWKSRIF